MRVRTRVPFRNGFTFTELIVVTALAVGVIWIALPAMKHGVDLSVQSTVSSNEDRAELATFLKVVNELKKSRVTRVSADGRSVTYQQPISMTGDGRYVDSNGTITWGAKERTGAVVGNHYVLAFQEKRRVSEKVIGRDLNHDTDTNDTFSVGYLKRTTSNGDAVVMTPPVILVDAVNAKGDLNGDGNPDSMFEQENQFTVTLRTLFFKRGTKQTKFVKQRVFLAHMDPHND